MDESERAETKAEKIEKLLRKDTIDEEEILIRKQMLRFWPEYPTEAAII